MTSLRQRFIVTMFFHILEMGIGMQENRNENLIINFPSAALGVFLE